MVSGEGSMSVQVRNFSPILLRGEGVSWLFEGMFCYGLWGCSDLRNGQTTGLCFRVVASRDLPS